MKLKLLEDKHQEEKLKMQHKRDAAIEKVKKKKIKTQMLKY